MRSLLLLSLTACSLPWSKPSAPSPPSNLSFGPATDPVTGTASTWTAIATQWWWMSLLLLLFVPQLRAPIAAFWNSVFSALAVPFLWVRNWWESKKK